MMSMIFDGLGRLMCVGVVWGISMDPKHTFVIFPNLRKHMIHYPLIYIMEYLSSCFSKMPNKLESKFVE